MALGYGTDVSLTDKLVSGRLITGKAVVIEAMYRRLITPRGTLADDLIYGFDVSGFIGAVGIDRSLSVVSGMIVNELSKDDRVVNVSCEASVSTTSGGTLSLLLEIAASLADSDEDFAFTVGASEVTTQLLAGA